MLPLSLKIKSISAAAIALGGSVVEQREDNGVPRVSVAKGKV